MQKFVCRGALSLGLVVALGAGCSFGEGKVSGGGAGAGAAGTGAGGATGVAGTSGAAGTAGTTGAGGTTGLAGTGGSIGPGDGGAGSSGEAGSGYVGADKLTCTPAAGGDGEMDLTAGLNADPPEWKLGTGVKAGTLTASASFASQIYGQHFPYRIYASANVVKGQPAVFMTFGDGGTYIGRFHTPTVLDNLTAAGDLPPTVALFVDPPSDGDRVQTYDPPTDKYARFLMEELIPAVIEPTYTISKDPSAWATGGYSASAEQGWTVLWKTERFQKFFGHNSSFGAAPTYGVDWAKTIAGAAPRSLRVSLVTAAEGKDLVDQRGDWTKINRAVATALGAKGDAFRFIIGPGSHGGPAGERDFPTALRWGFSGCRFAP